MESVQVLTVYQRRYCWVEKLTFQKECHLDGKQEDLFIEKTRRGDKALLQG